MPRVSEPYLACAGQAQGNKEQPGPGNEPQHVPSSSGLAMHTDENEELVITSMKLLYSV